MKHKLYKFSLTILASIFANVASAYDFQVDGFYYTFITQLDSHYQTVELSRVSKDKCMGSVTISMIIARPYEVFNSNYLVERIGYNAFGGCDSMTSITIPYSPHFQRICRNAFLNCTGLKSVTFPGRVQTIDDDAFAGCTNLKNIVVTESFNEYNYYNSRENCNAIIESSSNKLILGCMNTTIPNGVKSIGMRAFASCTGLTSITLPNTVTSIEQGAFKNCTGLTSITIPNSVTTIRDAAFGGCTGLTSFTIPKSVTTIRSNAFYGCFFLKGSFVNSSNLTHSNHWGATLCDQETNDGLLLIGNTVVKCRPWATSVIIPSNVTTISDNAFSDCIHLTSVNIPNSVTSIGDCAFSGCTELKDVYCYAETVPNTNSSAFEESNIKFATLHVPITSMGVYKTTSPWDEFGTIIAIEIPSAGISLNQTTLTFNAANQTAMLTATVTPSNATNRNVKWTSSNTAVATVSSAGVVTSKGNGTAVITATTTDGTNLTATCDVTVSIPVLATGISLNQTTLTFNAANQTAMLTATVAPSNTTNKNVTWTSSNTAVATVSSTGVVTSKANGTTVITATTTDGTNLSATCIVTVTNDEDSFITFADANVKAICVANWDINDDGELSKVEASVVTSIGDYFNNNMSISSFNEFRYFTSVTKLGDGTFRNCSSLTSITIPRSVISIGNYSFSGCTSLKTVIIEGKQNK